jgi:hypothetical protein
VWDAFEEFLESTPVDLVIDTEASDPATSAQTIAVALAEGLKPAAHQA